MSAITLNDIKSGAMLLSIQGKALLVRELLEALDETEDDNIEEIWLIEAEKRLAHYHQGQAKTRTATEVFANIKAQLK